MESRELSDAEIRDRVLFAVCGNLMSAATDALRAMLDRIGERVTTQEAIDKAQECELRLLELIELIKAGKKCHRCGEVP